MVTSYTLLRIDVAAYAELDWSGTCSTRLRALRAFGEFPAAYSFVLDLLGAVPVGPGGGPVKLGHALVLSHVADPAAGRPFVRIRGVLMRAGGAAKRLLRQQPAAPRKGDGGLPVLVGVPGMPLRLLQMVHRHTNRGI